MLISKTWLLGLVPLLALGASHALSNQGRRVHVALVDKGVVKTFFNRLAAEEGQLVTTATPVAGAHASVTVELDDEQRTFIVENAPKAALPGEVTRIGSFAVVRMPYGKDPHDVLGSHHIYAEEIATRETTVPNSSKQAIRARVTEGGVTVDIDRAFLEQKLKEFSGAVATTINGRSVTISERRSTTGRNNARAWLKQEYERIGFTTSEHTYGSSLSRGVNFVAEKAGADTGRYVVLTAHLDSVGNAGADDDGAGTISALAIAQALKDSPLRYNLRVVGFDQEETGLVGSAAYARKLNDDDTLGGLVGLINLEMTGYDSDNDGGFHVIDCNENTSAELSALVTNVMQRDQLRLQRVTACTNRSDHASFWRYDKPAIVISENFFGGDGNPCYHEACDRVDQLNFDYMQKVTTAVGRATADLVVEE